LSHDQLRALRKYLTIHSMGTLLRTIFKRASGRRVPLTQALDPMLRATRDQKVVDAWKALVDNHKSPFFVERTVAAIVLVLSLLLGNYSKSQFAPWALGLAAISLVVFVVLILLAHIFDRLTLRCPHCKQVPVSGRGDPKLADFCDKCHYWLRPPY
jgi:hypothetical protein